MLTSVTRASLRRLVALPLRPLPTPVAARAPVLSSSLRYLSATSRASEAAAKPKTTTKTAPAAGSAKKGTKKAAATKATKKKATGKAKPKPKKAKKPKKVKSPEEVTKEKVRELKEKALMKEPSLLPDTTWLVYTTQNLKGTAGGQDLPARAKALSETFKELSSFETERLKEKAVANRQANAAAYATWVQSHTPEQVRDANRARALLNRKYDTFLRKRLRKIPDERQPKQPTTPWAFFVKARWARGDLSGAPAGVASQLSAEWKALSDAEKKVYFDQSAGESARYASEKAATSSPA